MQNYNVLVFPGGTEVGLEINRALGQCKEVRLFSVNNDDLNHAPYTFARNFVIPNINEPFWIDCLNKIVEKWKIDYIFPAYDDILVALATNAGKIKAGIVSSPLNTCLVTRSKSWTYHVFEDLIPVPTLYHKLDKLDYPAFVKPDRGQGTQNTHTVYDREHLDRVLIGNRNYLIMEYLPGKEYTIDCFSDRDRGLLFYGGRERTRIRNGIAVHSHSVVDRRFKEYAFKINQALEMHGAWFFQVKEDCDGILKLMEIAPRIAGTMALHRVQGINFPLLSIYEQERLPIQIMRNQAEVDIDRALVNRYKHHLTYSTVYVDLDDTLILDEWVNTNLIRFLYQCINRKIRIVLLTRHRENIKGTLEKHRLAGIFDDINVCVLDSVSKAEYILEDDAILIDDSFSERRAVYEETGISTFDCSMLEMLIDERV